MALEIDSNFEISQQPALLPLQHLQVMTEAIDDPVKRELAAKTAVGLVPTSEIIGRYFGVKTTLAIGRSDDLPANRRLVYEQGLHFLAKATGIDYYRNYDVPVDSVVIDFKNVHTMIDRAEYEIDEDITEEYMEAPKLIDVRVPILAIQACAVEFPRTA